MTAAVTRDRERARRAQRIRNKHIHKSGYRHTRPTVRRVRG